MLYGESIHVAVFADAWLVPAESCGLPAPSSNLYQCIGATVVGTVEKQGKQKKVVTYKYKPKKGSHRKQGHRQPYTKVVINAINA